MHIFFVRLANVLQVRIDARIGAHQHIQQLSLLAGDVILAQLMARYKKLHARLGLVFLFKIDITRLCQDMQGGVGLQYGQFHDLA